jgi:penicillin-binding protein 2
VRAVENPDARLDPLAFPALPALDWKPEHVAVIRNALYGVTQEGTSALNQRALQVGRRPAPRR